MILNKIKISAFALLMSGAMYAQQTQQLVFVAGDDPATPEIFIQKGTTAYMYIQGGISAVNTTESPSGGLESNIVGGTYTGAGTGNVVVNGGLFINANSGTPGHVRNATNSKFVFDYTDPVATPSGAELNGAPMPVLLGSNQITATWGGTVHMMIGTQLFSGNPNASSDIRFFNLSLEDNASKNVEERGHIATDNNDFVDIEIGANASGSNLTGTLFLNGSVLNTRDNLALVLNPQADDVLATAPGNSIVRLAGGSGAAGTSAPLGMSLTSQNSTAASQGYVTSTNSTRGRLGRVTTSGNYLFPVADETGFYRPTGIIGASSGTYYSRVQQTAGTVLGSATPTAILKAFYNVVNTNPSSLGGEYRLYATLNDINNNDISIGSPPCTSTEVFNTAAPNFGTAQSETIADTWGFQQGAISAPAGTADLSYTTSVSYPTTPLPGPGGCATLIGLRVAFKARPAAASATDIEESYVVATKPWVSADACFNSTLIPCANPLPVELLTFDGLMKDKHDELIWKTASEVNVSHFELEYSRDGANFTKIGHTMANNSPSDYKGYNYNPIIGNNYYRLKMVDNDNSFKYSNIVVLQRKISKIQITGLIPNPTTDVVQVNVVSPTDGKMLIHLFDTNGKEIMTKEHEVSEGKATVQLDLRSYAFGMYLLQVQLNGQTSSAKVIKE